MTLAAWSFFAVLRLMPTVDPAVAFDVSEAVGAAAANRGEAAVLVSLAWWESGRSFDCLRDGDGAESVSCWQVRVCRRIDERCVRARGDIAYAAVIAIDMARASMAACADLDAANALSLFTTGKCQTNVESRLRWNTAQRLLREVPAADDNAESQVENRSGTCRAAA